MFPDSVFPHPNYDSEDNQANNDIALIYIEDDLPIVQVSQVSSFFQKGKKCVEKDISDQFRKIT